MCIVCTIHTVDYVRVYHTCKHHHKSQTSKARKKEGENCSGSASVEASTQQRTTRLHDAICAGPGGWEPCLEQFGGLAQAQHHAPITSAAARIPADPHPPHDQRGIAEGCPGRAPSQERVLVMRRAVVVVSAVIGARTSAQATAGLCFARCVISCGGRILARSLHGAKGAAVKLTSHRGFIVNGRDWLRVASPI